MKTLPITLLLILSIGSAEDTLTNSLIDSTDTARLPVSVSPALKAYFENFNFGERSEAVANGIKALKTLSTNASAASFDAVALNYVASVDDLTSYALDKGNQILKSLENEELEKYTLSLENGNKVSTLIHLYEPLALEAMRKEKIEISAPATRKYMYELYYADANKIILAFTFGLIGYEQPILEQCTLPQYKNFSKVCQDKRFLE